MDIDLNNLVFDGLEEAQERNAERLEDADKKPRRLLRMMTAAMPAKYNDRTGVMPVFYSGLSRRKRADFVPVCLARLSMFSVLFYHGTTPDQCWRYPRHTGWQQEEQTQQYAEDEAPHRTVGSVDVPSPQYAKDV